MLNIFICEDNKEQLEQIERIIQEVIIMKDYDMRVVVSTESPYDLLEYVQNNKAVGIYFLDVDLKTKMDGIQLGVKIREYDPRGFIIYITTHAELSYLTFEYKVEALDYIIKSNIDTIRERIKACLLNINTKQYADATDHHKYFYIKREGKTIGIEFSKIIFFETVLSTHKIKLYTDDSQFEFYDSIKEIEAKLDQRFCRCHKAVIVNIDKIKEIDRKERLIHLINGQKCYMSVRGMRCLKKRLQ